MITLSDLRVYALDALRPPLRRISETIPPMRADQVDAAMDSDPVLSTIKTLLTLVGTTRFYMIGNSEVQELWRIISQQQLLVDTLFDATTRLIYQLDAHLFTVAIQTDSARITVQDYIKQTVGHSTQLTHRGEPQLDTDTFVERESSSETMVNFYIENTWLFTLFVASLTDITRDVLTPDEPGYAGMAAGG